jgi:hypothetical protein
MDSTRRWANNRQTDYAVKLQAQKKHPKVLFCGNATGLFGAQYCETFFEAVNTTTYVQNFLLTSVERVAS